MHVSILLSHGRKEFLKWFLFYNESAEVSQQNQLIYYNFFQHLHM